MMYRLDVSFLEINKISLIKKIYHVQNNISVQTVQIQIWVTRSTSKKRGVEGVRGGICKSVITQSKGRRLIVKLTNFHTSWMLIRWSDWNLHGLHG